MHAVGAGGIQVRQRADRPLAQEEVPERPLARGSVSVARDRIGHPLKVAAKFIEELADRDGGGRGLVRLGSGDGPLAVVVGEPEFTDADGDDRGGNERPDDAPRIARRGGDAAVSALPHVLQLQRGYG